MCSHLGTRAAHCEIDCKFSRLGTDLLRPAPGELESAGGSPGLMFTPEVDDTDMRLLRRLPVLLLRPVRLLERERPMCVYESGEREEMEEVEEVEEAQSRLQKKLDLYRCRREETKTCIAS